LSLNTMNLGFKTPNEHIAAIKEFAHVMGLS
jgi:hypothetical protein